MSELPPCPLCARHLIDHTGCCGYARHIQGDSVECAFAGIKVSADDWTRLAKLTRDGLAVEWLQNYHPGWEIHVQSGRWSIGIEDRPHTTLHEAVEKVRGE